MPTLSEQFSETVYELRAAGTPWQAIYDAYPNVPPPTLRRLNHEERARRGELEERQKPPTPRIKGWAVDEEIDEQEVLHRALAEWRGAQRRAQRQASQSIEFDHGPVCIANLGDQHMGDPGTNYPRMFEEAQLVADTPGMYAFLIGDLVNQFVIGRLRAARDNHRLAIVDEWALAKMYLEVIADKLLGAVGGNHDFWHVMLTGVDYFGDVMAKIAPGRLYDAHQVDADVCVGGASVPFRWRHQWAGNSIYNPTHGIERAARLDGAGFRVGVGGHTHQGGYARGFNADGQQGLAVLVGTYKEEDGFARQMGFGKPNGCYGVAVVITERGTLVGFEKLEDAAEYMRAVYSD